MAGHLGFTRSVVKQPISPWNNVDSRSRAALEASSQSQHAVKLVAEDEEGSVEYKLHLLLRFRRNYIYPTQLFGTTGGRKQKKSPKSVVSVRRNRLEHLTTQLLRRIQAGQPGFIFASTLPQIKAVLPEDATIAAKLLRWGPHSGMDSFRPQWLVGPLVPGIEFCPGALYELGIADDGTIVGLAQDEMDESLSVLISMAQSIGCIVEVTLNLRVGRCAWEEDGEVEGEGGVGRLRESDLWVAEALVRPPIPGQDLFEVVIPDSVSLDSSPNASLAGLERLRVAFAGAAGSGKSTLLGTLLTGTLDDGRGLSRSSLTLQIHEVSSARPSPTRHKAMVYRYIEDGEERFVDVVESHKDANILPPGVKTPDVLEPRRVSFFSDFSGLPEFEQATVGGLIGWSPHWNILCHSAPSSSGSASVVDSDYFKLYLALNLKMVVVYTKLDYADISLLRVEVQGSLIPALRRAGRKALPVPSGQPGPTGAGRLPAATAESVRARIEHISPDDTSIVPIVFSSAVTGVGIDQLHSLFYQLPSDEPGPIPGPYQAATGASETARPDTIFQIETVDSATAFTLPGVNSSRSSKVSIALSGIVRRGSLQPGSEVFIGPFGSTHGGGTAPPHRRGRMPPTPEPSETTSEYAPFTGWHRGRVSAIISDCKPAQALPLGGVGTIEVIVNTDDDLDHGQDNALLDGIRRGKIVAVVSSSSSPSSPGDDLSGPPKLIVPAGAATGVHVRFTGVAAAHPVAARIRGQSCNLVLYSGSVCTPCRVTAVECGREQGGLEGVDAKFVFLDGPEYIDVGTSAYVALEGDVFGGISGQVMSTEAGWL